MYVENIALVTVIVIALFALPIVVIAIRQKNPKPLNFLHHLTKVFNKAFIIQLIVGLLLIMSMFIINETVYGQGYSSIFFEIFIGVAYVYIVVGFFIYLPALGLLI